MVAPAKVVLLPAIVDNVLMAIVSPPRSYGKETKSRMEGEDRECHKSRWDFRERALKRDRYSQLIGRLRSVRIQNKSNRGYSVSFSSISSFLSMKVAMPSMSFSHYSPSSLSLSLKTHFSFNHSSAPHFLPIRNQQNETPTVFPSTHGKVVV